MEEPVHPNKASSAKLSYKTTQKEAEIESVKLQNTSFGNYDF